MQKEWGISRKKMFRWNVVSSLCYFCLAKPPLVFLSNSTLSPGIFIIGGHCFSIVDTYFKTYLSCRNDLLLSNKILEDDGPFSKNAVLQILRVVQTILENCHNKSSFDGLELYKRSWITVIQLCHYLENWVEWSFWLKGYRLKCIELLVCLTGMMIQCSLVNARDTMMTGYIPKRGLSRCF